MSNVISTEHVRLQRRLQGKVRRFLGDHDLLPGDGLLVAVSGGPDSSALLHILASLAAKQRPRIVAAYFDHRLRGAGESRREIDAVRALCAALGVPLVCGSGDAGALAKQRKLGLEEAARHLRYEFLAASAVEAGCSRVATGHTASDQAETVLMHILRGAGLRGLGAMSPLAAWPIGGQPSLRLVRPLLCLSRAETRAYCLAAGLNPLEDESNLSPRFRRNRVRNEVIPLLRQFNPRVEEALGRLAEAVRDAVDETEADAGLLRVGAGGVRLSRDGLVAVARNARRETILKACEAIRGDRRGLSQRHVVAIERLLLQGRTGDRLNLPAGLRAVLLRDELELSLDGPLAALPAQPVLVAVPGETEFGDLLVSVGPRALTGAIAVAQIDASVASPSLTVRRRKPGDRFQPLGMQESKKLQDFFVDEHMPRNQRDSVPLFETDRGIIWVGGLRVAEWAKPQPGAATLTLSYRRLD